MKDRILQQQSQSTLPFDCLEILFLQLPLLVFTSYYLQFCLGCLYAMVLGCSAGLVNFALLCISLPPTLLFLLLPLSPLLGLLTQRLASNEDRRKKIAVLLLTALLPLFVGWQIFTNGGLSQVFMVGDAVRSACMSIGLIFEPGHVTNPLVQGYLALAIVVISCRRMLETVLAKS